MTRHVTHVQYTDPALFRPSDLAYSGGDPSRAADGLGWRAVTQGADIVRQMVAADQTFYL